MARKNFTDSIATKPRELDSRASDAIHVQLLWHPRDNRVSVAVSDTKTGEAFELDVRHGQRALDVFRHPYAYAELDPALTPALQKRSAARSERPGFVLARASRPRWRQT
jgi:hypothetical protein